MRKDKESVARAQVNRLGRPSVEQLNRECARLERRGSYWRMARGVLIGLVLAAALTVLLTNLWVAVLRVDGSSMNPLLHMGQVVIAVKNDTPGQGDVIAFYQGNKAHIKRVVAVAGEQVDIDENGAVTVNGAKLDEPYVKEPSLGSRDIEFPYLVPAGTVFVLGDNRANSLDSRNSRFGPVPREQIIGKVVFSVWPLRGAGKIR